MNSMFPLLTPWAYEKRAIVCFAHDCQEIKMMGNTNMKYLEGKNPLPSWLSVVWCCTLIWCRLQLTDHPAKGVGVLSLQKCLTSENTAVPGMYRPTSLYLMTDLSIPFMRHPVRNSQTISIVLFSTSIQWIWKNPFELCELGKL